MTILECWDAASGMASYPMPGGHINDTFRVGASESQPSFVLQRINRYVFANPEGVMRNLVRITRHVDADYLVAPVLTRSGEAWARDENHDVWRLLPYVRGRTLDRLSGAALHAAGFAFGRFLRDVRDFDEPLDVAIEGFHDLPRYLRELDDAARGRGLEELEFVSSRAASGRDVATQVIHGDCKINNLIFHVSEPRVTHVIDLDTVMRGRPAWDFGDLVRSVAAGVEESKAADSISIEKFREVARGFAEGLEEPLEPEEFAGAPSHMSFMLGVRFLTDHLRGDKYFKVERPGQNLERARSQFALTRAMDAVRGDMERVVRHL